MPFEIREVGWPELLVAGNPLRNVGERDRRELVDALSPIDSAAALLPHQPRIAQYPQMSRYCGAAYPETGRDLARRRGTAPQAVQDRPPRWICDRVERVCPGNDTRHAEICNKMVTQYPVPSAKCPAGQHWRILPSARYVLSGIARRLRCRSEPIRDDVPQQSA